jgi:hypothetical protein
MIASQAVCVQAMGGLAMINIHYEKATTIPMLRMDRIVLEPLILTLGFLTTKGFQHIWQIKLDNMGRIMGALVM